ncbi:MAG: hypothetical protein ACOX9A_08180 [Anaerolineae bacterium]|jgi:hypothetical protein
MAARPRHEIDAKHHQDHAGHHAPAYGAAQKEGAEQHGEHRMAAGDGESTAHTQRLEAGEVHKVTHHTADDDRADEKCCARCRQQSQIVLPTGEEHGGQDKE